VTYRDHLTSARKRKGYSQRSLALKEDVHVSKESIAKYESGTRKIPNDMYEHLSKAIDDTQLYFESWEATTGHVSIPFLDGPVILRQAAAMVHLVKKEAIEAIEQVEKTCWYTPPDHRSKEDLEALNRELLDSAASMMNLVAVLCEENGLSMKDTFQKWRVSLKARKYEQ